MIYEELEIAELLNCEQCLLQFDRKFSPKLLPCCGKTMCSTCIQHIENKIQDEIFKCISCNKVDTLPNNGFQINFPIARLIEKQSKEISTGIQAKNETKSVFK